MPITELNHFLLVAKDLERTRDFYQRVLGMELDKARPDFGFPGYWLKANGETCVHLASQAPNKIRTPFCVKCAEPLTDPAAPCAMCGKYNRMGSRFCIYCGNRLR